MTSNARTIAIVATLAAVLGLGAGMLFNGAASASPRQYIYDIDKEDAQFGDFSGWNGDLEEEDARFDDPALEGQELNGWQPVSGVSPEEAGDAARQDRLRPPPRENSGKNEAPAN